MPYTFTKDVQCSWGQCSDQDGVLQFPASDQVYPDIERDGKDLSYHGLFQLDSCGSFASVSALDKDSCYTSTASHSKSEAVSGDLFKYFRSVDNHGSSLNTNYDIDRAREIYFLALLTTTNGN